MWETAPLVAAWPSAMSTTAGICTGTFTRTLYSATSSNSWSRWTSAWKGVPSTRLSSSSVMASTGWWSSLAS